MGRLLGPKLLICEESREQLPAQHTEARKAVPALGRACVSLQKAGCHLQRAASFKIFPFHFVVEAQMVPETRFFLFIAEENK